MQDRHIGDVRVTRIEEQMGPGFPAKDFFPEFDADTFAAEGHWLAPSYYQPESGRLMSSIHSWLLRTGKYTILVDACSGNHKPRPGMPRFDMLNSQYLDRLREAGVQRGDRLRDVHPPACRPCRWNTRLENGKWVPTFAGQVCDVAHRPRSLVGAGQARYRDLGQHLQRSVLPIVEAKKAEFVSNEHGTQLPRSSPRPAIRRARSASI
jgi:hypothetical protein